MDILYAIVAWVSIVIGAGCLTIVFGDELEEPNGKKWALIIALICFPIATWIIHSKVTYDPKPTVLVKGIEEIRNIPYYFDENDRPVELVNDWKFADPKTTEVHIKMYPSGWYHGVYIDGWRKVELVKKTEVEVKP